MSAIKIIYEVDGFYVAEIDMEYLNSIKTIEQAVEIFTTSLNSTS